MAGAANVPATSVRQWVRESKFEPWQVPACVRTGKSTQRVCDSGDWNVGSVRRHRSTSSRNRPRLCPPLSEHRSGPCPRIRHRRLAWPQRG